MAEPEVSGRVGAGTYIYCTDGQVILELCWVRLKKLICYGAKTARGRNATVPGRGRPSKDDRVMLSANALRAAHGSAVAGSAGGARAVEFGLCPLPTLVRRRFVWARLAVTAAPGAGELRHFDCSARSSWGRVGGERGLSNA